MQSDMYGNFRLTCSEPCYRNLVPPSAVRAIHTVQPGARRPSLIGLGYCYRAVPIVSFVAARLIASFSSHTRQACSHYYLL